MITKLLIPLICLFQLLSTQVANASFPEFFGTSFTTSSIGNQGNMNFNDPSNLYYSPALAGFSDTVALSMGLAVVKTDFDPITNIVTENSTNSSTSSTGSVSTEYQSYEGSNIQFILPIRIAGAGALGISVFTPIGKLAETNSGDPELPEYVMYRARYRRSQIHVNYGHPWSKTLAFSVGAHIGFQAGANVGTKISLTDNFGSSGSTKTEVRPSVGAILSVASRTDVDLMSFTFQQEMKSNFEATAFGDIADPSLTLVNIGFESMIYYDPHIFRFAYSREFGDLQLHGSLEYQLWGNYKNPTIKIINKGGSVRKSNDYETIKTRNVFVPKAGLTFQVDDNISLMAGVAYRQTPLDSDFSGAGNSVDMNTLIITGGSGLRFKFMGTDLQLGANFEYHRLEEQTVVKTSGQENGNSGNKIGAPGYQIGGTILAISSGLKIEF